MEMCYNGNLVMPSNYVVVNADEMEYIDGGIYISNQTLWTCCKAAFYSVAFNPVGSTLVALGAYKCYTLLAAGIAKVAVALGAWSRVLGIAFGIIGVGALLGFGYDIVDALMQGKGINIGVKKAFGIPYGIDVDVI
jgi:hypothetical protein